MPCIEWPSNRMIYMKGTHTDLTSPASYSDLLSPTHRMGFMLCRSTALSLRLIALSSFKNTLHKNRNNEGRIGIEKKIE